MANISFTTDTRIIRDLYNTADAAQQASLELGCDGGYRTYLINGETKYVPCSSYVQYENALRYRVAQGKIGAFGSDTFGDKLVGLQFANAKDEISGDPFFTMGNFGINKSVPFSQNQARQVELNIAVESTQNDATKSFTVESIAQRNLAYFEGKSYIEALKRKVDSNITATVLFDRRKLDNYVLFSSLKDRIKNVLIEIYNQYPAAIKSSAVSILNPSIVDYVTYPIEKRSEFKVNLYGITNPFNIEYTSTGITLETSELITPYRNFSKTYKDYVVYYDGVEYPILSATLPQNYNDDGTGIKLVINGDPFSSMVNVNGELNIGFYIKPKESIYTDFNDNLSDLASFLLNEDDNGNYPSEFLFPKISDDGQIVNIKETVYFPKFDDFNIDMFGDRFDIYTTKLNDLAESYDSVKTNLIARFLTTDSLQEFDTQDRKVNLIFQLYGKQFDEVKKYIDGITFMRNVSYNKIENVPDLLVKNFANMLGFKTYEIEDENSLIESLFQVDPKNLTKSITPAELDIEIWRRIMINAFYLFKSKGTRKSIEFILKLVGLPNEVFDLNEYVYTADKPVRVSGTLNSIYDANFTFDPNTLLGLMPFDSEGYPTVPKTVNYQENGGYLYEDKTNVGLYDFGKKYINEYKKFNNTRLFSVDRTPDNVKSWVYSDTKQDYVADTLNGYTEYTTDSSRLVINSKELEIYLASNRVFDVTVYRQYMRNIGQVNADLNIDSALKFDATNISFNQFVKQSLDNFISPYNRKTIKTYPTLTKIYFDYLKTTSTPITSTVALDFLSKFDTSWVKLIEQFVPATSIVNAGKKIQNSIFLDNKFIYKHGKNVDVSWLGTDGSEFQQGALKPVYLGTTNVTENKGTVRETIVGDALSFQISGKQGAKIMGVDPTINEYFGAHYSMFEFCDTTEGNFYIWESGVDYGDDSIFGGNINAAYGGSSGIPRKGVFVIYDNKLYRLNTTVMQNDFLGLNDAGTGGIHTAGAGLTGLAINATLPPNVATLTYNFGGDTFTVKLWEHINMSVDSRTITFEDSPAASASYGSPTVSFNEPEIGAVERSFYMNSIGRALSYIQIGIDFDCPPPNPHVCYYDFSGRTINLSTFTGTTYSTYSDEIGSLLSVKQPKFYGYGRDYSTQQPTNSTYGSFNKWVVPYKKRFAWENGKVYYKGEIIAKIHATNKDNLVPSSDVYIVTGSTVTGTTTYPTTLDPTGLRRVAVANSTPTSGATVNTTTVASGITGGMYERYQDRTKTDPFMHIDTAYISKIKLNPNLNRHSINLTKSLNLLHIFSGVTAGNTYRVSDNIVNNELFISDTISLSFDGFYHIDSNKMGPFYTLQDDNIFTHTLSESLLLQADVDNYVSIQSLNESFRANGNDLTLINSTPGYYLITRNSFLNFNFNLYFESISNVLQSVEIKLVNNLGYVYDTQVFDFIGDDNADLRQYLFQYSGFFNANEKIYLVIKPLNLSCTLSRYERIDYQYADPVTYIPLDDPRFRLLFNSGFVGKEYHSDGFSIKPIYNLADFGTNSIQYKNDALKYTELNIPEVNYSSDPVFLLNLMFYKYYERFAQGSLVYDTSVYDKELGNDKIDFTFKIRSKNDNIVNTGVVNTGSQVGVESSVVEYDFSFLDYYLGNTPPITEFGNVTNAISIGKRPINKVKNYARSINYIPSSSFYNGVALGSGLIPTVATFISYDDGINDYTKLNYSFDFVSELKLKKRFYTGVPGATNFGYYKLEDGVYDSEIYKAILNKVPLFSPRIVNYELNDVVKVPIENYKVVVDTATGKTIEIRTVNRLYVCVNDIHPQHCYRSNITGSGTVQGEIHEIYRPRGSRSCFVPIEKYNTSNFTPWGYEDLSYNGSQNANITDYIYKNIKGYDPENIDYKFGDLVLGNYRGNDIFFKYIYQKPTVYSSTTTYRPGDFVFTSEVSGTDTYYRYYCARTTTTGNAPPIATLVGGVAPSGVNSTWNTHWMRIGGDLFDHRSLIGSPGTGGLETSGITSFGNSWIDWDSATAFASTAARIPKTLPVTNGGMPYITTGDTSSYTFGGISYGLKYNSLLNLNKVFIDQSYQHLDEYETISVNRLFRAKNTHLGATDIKNYSGVTTTITRTETDNYVDYNSSSRLGKTNIYLKPGYPINGSNPSYYNYPFFNDLTGASPLFERLGFVDEKNNPSVWIPGADVGPTFSGSIAKPLFLGNKYTVNRGVLYKYMGTAPLTYSSGLAEPYANPTNFEERDFCLVNNFVFYKDRTKISVFESDVSSLTTDVKNTLYFHNQNLTLKNGFTSRNFSGSTINNRLVTALDKFYDITDTNRVTPGSHGIIDFRASGSDVIMDYYPEKDQVGYPLTGEFMGKLKLSNPCGQTATTFFGILFDTDVTLLDRSTNVSVTAITVPQAADILPYVVRVIISQSANANATVRVKTVDVNLVSSNDDNVVNKFSTFDKKYDIIPDTNMTIELTYNTGRLQTTFQSASVDGTPLFVNDNVINTTTINTTLSKVVGSETRTITLKNITANKTVYINLSGITNSTVGNTNTTAIFDVKNINVPTSKL
jgi:hypothetical protein